jgi:hypothetical protein
MVYPSADTEDGDCMVYCWATSPTGPYQWGGIIISSLGETVANPYRPGETITTGIGNNIHGGMVEIKGHWYQFYHRHTGEPRKARQAMVVPIDVRIEGGKVVIPQVEWTSQGFAINGLDPYEKQNAGITCYMHANLAAGTQRTDDNSPWINTHTYNIFDYSDSGYKTEKQWTPIVNIRNQSWVGWKYFDFGSGAASGEQLKMVLTLKEKWKMTVNVYASDPKSSFTDAEKPKTKIGSIDLPGRNMETHTVEIPLDTNLTGKKGIYLEFLSEVNNFEICQLNNLQFVRQ